jgi:hypothetical protein
MPTNMNARLLTALTLMAIALSSGAEAQVDQQALARQILAEDRATARGAFYQVRRTLAPEEMGPELRSALITVLERQNRIYREDFEAASAHEGLPPSALQHRPELFWGMGFADLLETVFALGEPKAIPALADALVGFWWVTYPGLTRLGELAAPALLDIAEGGAWHRSQVRRALAVLTLMIEEPTGPPLSQATLQRVDQIARKQLTTGPTYPSVLADFPLGRRSQLQAAISLALSLDDPSLRELVQALAREPEAVRRLGIDDPAAMENVQRHAAQELARRPSR